MSQSAHAAPALGHDLARLRVCDGERAGRVREDWCHGHIAAAADMYYENMHVSSWGQQPGNTPTGVAVFAEDVAIRRYGERGNDIVHWSEFQRSEFQRGGHFAAMEAPALLVGDIRAFFRTQR